jgi:signal transduction histidine kinase
MSVPDRVKRERPTLLVVDDEAEVLRSIYDLLRLDYKVLTAERGPDALKVLEEQPVSVVMSDQRMPEMTGVEFLGRAREIRPESTRLLFTGYADLKAVIDAINRGQVFRYVPKPWDPEELTTIIRQAVEHHDLLADKRRLIKDLQETNAQLEEANRLKKVFIEVASHELNTPVAVILGMTELWRLSQAPDAADSERAWVDRIHSAGRRLAGSVERMLKLLWADRFDRTLEPRPTELEPLIMAVVGELGPYLVARGQTLRLDAEPAVGSAEVDPDKIADVLSNLIVNAIKFTPDQGTIVLEAGPVGPDHVRFVVRDQGAGIGEEDRKHIFDPFFTGYDTLHHSSGDFQFGKRGIGLGLSLVKKFVELHHGTVELESEPGHGSAFKVVLPRAQKT